ncbi:MAG: nucleoside deaminase [Clostridia bacterium]
MNEIFMKRAIDIAKQGLEFDEVPIGAVIVKNGEIIAEAHNLKETNNCAVFHAEIVAITLATKVLSSWRLHGCDIYVTLEPCPMCAGALINSRIDNIFFGAYDKKAGCCGTLYNLPQDVRFNHRVGVVGGILEGECVKLLSDYFKTKRISK